MSDRGSTALEGTPRWATFASGVGDGDGASSTGDDASSVAHDMFGDEDSNEGSINGDVGDVGGVHAAAPMQGGGTPHLHFGNSIGPWLSSATVFGENGEKPSQVVVIEIPHAFFENNGGDLCLDSILNVELDDMVSTTDQHREAVTVLLNLLLGPTVGGAVCNGTQEEEDDPSDKKDKVYKYRFKDPLNANLAHPCFTIHIEEVPDQVTQEPFKYRLWYMVWDPGFTVARSVLSQLIQNGITYKEAHLRGTAAGKKKLAAQADISKSREHVKTRVQSITDGGDLHNEFQKYFGDRSAKVNAMNCSEYDASFGGTAPLHPCAFENMLNPRDAQNGPAVLNSTAVPPNVTFHPDQADPSAYFNQEGRFRPPQYVLDNTLFHTLHPKFVNNLDVRLQTLPSRGVQTPGRALLINHFASVHLKEHPDLPPRAKARSFEAYLAGKDHNPSNTTRSREESAAWRTAKFAFSGNKYAQKHEHKDGVRRQINPLKELRTTHDRLDRLLAEGAPKRGAEANQKLHEAARELVLNNVKTAMEQRKRQLPLGTRHAWEKGVELMNMRKTPMSTTHDKQHMKNKSIFHGAIERLTTFARDREKLEAQDPAVIILFMINSMVSSTGEPGFIASVFGPAGVGKSTLMHLFDLMSLDGMNQESQIQSLKARLRADPYNGYHEWLDEASALFESLKITNKTAEQLDQMNSLKRKVTEQMTAHGIPEEVLQDDGRKMLEDVQLLVEHSQSVTMLHNGNGVFGVFSADDMTKSVLRRLINYCVLDTHTGDQDLEDKKKNTALMTECEDYKKNEFLTRCLLILGQTSSEFEVDCKAANEIFRRMDLADGRPPMESGFRGHRRTILKVFTAWHAVQCIFDCSNYHDQLPELFNADGAIKPWSIEMMELCVPFLKTPNESIINYVWHFHDMLCTGRGPVVDQTMSLLVKESGFKMDGYHVDGDFMKTFNTGPKVSFAQKDLETIYNEATIRDVLAEVKKAEQGSSHALESKRKIEASVTGMCNFMKEKVHGRDYEMVNWSFMQTGVGNVNELAKILCKNANRELGLTEEVVQGALYWMKQYVTDYKGVEMDGATIDGQTQFCYKPSKKVNLAATTTPAAPAAPAAAADSDDETPAQAMNVDTVVCEEEEEELIKRAIYNYGQFPAMLAVASGRSTEQNAILVSKRGASNDKRQRGDNESTGTSTDFGLCVQTRVVRDHAMRDVYAKQYSLTHPQIESADVFLHQHGLARAKLIADKVFDQEDHMEMVTPYFANTTLSPLYVTTDKQCDYKVWMTASKSKAPCRLSPEDVFTINGIKPDENVASNRSTTSFDQLKTSELWMHYAFETLDRFGWNSDKWFRIMHDARTNGREHRNHSDGMRVVKPKQSTSAQASSSTSEMPKMRQFDLLD